MQIAVSNAKIKEHPKRLRAVFKIQPCLCGMDKNCKAASTNPEQNKKKVNAEVTLQKRKPLQESDRPRHASCRYVEISSANRAGRDRNGTECCSAGISCLCKQALPPFWFCVIYMFHIFYCQFFFFKDWAFSLHNPNDPWVCFSDVNYSRQSQTHKGQGRPCSLSYRPFIIALDLEKIFFLKGQQQPTFKKMEIMTIL